MVTDDAVFLDAWSRLRASGRPQLIHGLSDLALGEGSGDRGWDEAVAGFLRTAAAATTGEPRILFGCRSCQCQIEVMLPVAELLSAHDQAKLINDASPPVTVDDVIELAALPADEARTAASDRWSAEDEERHPMLAPSLAAGCPDCGTDNDVVIDAIGLAWAAIEDRARALLDDVVGLASAFGWSEPEVLAIPAERRRAYLELVGAAPVGVGPGSVGHHG